MPAEINYKNKYQELRAKYMNDLDMAFRLGFEQGQQQQQNNQMQQQEQQAHDVQMAAAQGQTQGGFGQEPGQSGQTPGQPGGDPEAAQGGINPAEAQNGSELDQHISKLEQAIAKSENLSGDPEIKKSLENLKDMRKKEVLTAQIRRNDNAVKAISKALHKPSFKFSKQASHNLNSNAKQAVSLQHKIVDDLMDKMEKEEARAAGDITSILAIEGITQKG